MKNKPTSKVILLVQKTKKLLKESFCYRRKYNSSFLRQLTRLLHLYLRESYSSEEISILGIADPKIENSELSRYISKKHLSAIQSKLNDIIYLSVTEDKAIFYSICKALSLPIPETYAVLFEEGGWVKDDGNKSGEQEWVDFFNNVMPCEAVIKPALGVYSYGFMLVEKMNNEWHTSCGQKLNSKELFKNLTANSFYDHFVIQERIHNHDEFEKLGCSQALQTLRVISLVDENQKVRVLHVNLRIVRGSNVVDNFASGKTGNLLAKINIETGRIVSVVGREDGEICRLKLIECFESDFEGFVLPFREQVVELVNEAALRFLPIRTIGWDIAVTPSGPIIIEGNQFWDPGQSFFGEADVLRKQLSGC